MGDVIVDQLTDDCQCIVVGDSGILVCLRIGALVAIVVDIIAARVTIE